MNITAMNARGSASSITSATTSPAGEFRRWLCLMNQYCTIYSEDDDHLFKNKVLYLISVEAEL